MVVDLLDTPEVGELSFDDELMEDPKDDLKKDAEENLEELGEHQDDHNLERAKSGASNCSFDSGKGSRDESDPDYDPSRDHHINIGANFSVRLHFEPHMYIVQLLE